MTTCRSCGTALRPLFSSWYCPNDCPRPRGDDRVGADQASPCPLPDHVAYQRLVVPVSTCPDVPAGRVAVADGRISRSWYPQRTLFNQETIDSFRVEEVSLCLWSGSSLVLWRVPGPDFPGPRGVALVDDLLRRVVVPCSVDLAFVVRNISKSPRRFVCAVLAYASPYEVGLHGVGLSEEDARKVDEALARCADGSPRRDFRDPAAW